MEYSEKLKDPRWQKLRLKVFERDNWECRWCNNTIATLTVHHLYYEKDKEPWDYPLDAFLTVCEPCHKFDFEQRYIAEQKLLAELKRKGFSPASTMRIAESVQNLHAGLHNTALFAFLIEWLLTEKDIQKKMLKMYAQFLKENNLL